MSGSPHAIGLGDLPLIGPAVLTLGVFDGVHRGHVTILEATRDAAIEQGVASVAIAFDPPPDEVLQSGVVVPRLAPVGTNLRRIEAVGITHAVALRFDPDIRRLTAEAFLAALAPAIEVRGLVMSRQSAFGWNRSGTVVRMQAHADATGMSLVVVEPIEIAGAIVSSSRIRRAIADGDMALARELGVRPYLEGTVVGGDRRGRELGFPTANLEFGYAPALPAIGVYAGWAALDGPGGALDRPSLVSVGTRPTFHPAGEVLTEVHLLDFDGDLYGIELGVELVARLRDERRFDGVAELVSQMRRDADEGRAALGLR
jgi:riboflavin kinase / FMN adenylyltransferase